MWSRALNCLPGELRKKIIESQETRNKLHSLYESVNKLSTTDALKVFHDGLSQRRVNKGDLEQNSDGSVLDSYYGQLQSLIVETPAIEVQSRDKAIYAKILQFNEMIVNAASLPAQQHKASGVPFIPTSSGASSTGP
ncbi:Essential protein Yae1, N-terminal, partial [Cynara cardunculus var. scolymus]